MKDTVTMMGSGRGKVKKLIECSVIKVVDINEHGGAQLLTLAFCCRVLLLQN